MQSLIRYLNPYKGIKYAGRNNSIIGFYRFSSTNVTSKLTWDEHSEIILKSIRECDFVAIDIEYTGLHLNDERYIGIDKSYEGHLIGTKDFIPCQIGLTMAKYLKCGNWKIIPTSIYTIPSDNKIFKVNTSTLSFLNENGFDFNQWIKNGIKHLKPIEEDEKKSIIVSQIDEVNRIIMNISPDQSCSSGLTPVTDLKDTKEQIYNETSTSEIYTQCSDNHADFSSSNVQSNSVPPEVTSTVGLADSSSNYLSLKSKATPGDRGDVQPLRTGNLPGGTKNVYPEERDIVNGPQVRPGSDLRELEGEVKGRADGRNVTSGGEAVFKMTSDGTSSINETAGIDNNSSKFDLNTIPDINDRVAIEDVMRKIDEWILSNDIKPLEIVMESAFQRLLMHTIINQQYPNIYSHSSRKGDMKLLCIYRSQLELYKQQKLLLENDLLILKKMLDYVYYLMKL